MKKICSFLLTIALLFTLQIPVYAAGGSVSTLEATATTSAVTVSGTTDTDIAAVMVEVLSDTTSLAYYSFEVSATRTFSGTISGLSLTAGSTYTVRAADYDGGSWTTISVTAVAAASPAAASSSNANTQSTAKESAPAVELSTETVAATTNQIAALPVESQTGETPSVEVSMMKADGTIATAIPIEILTALKGKDADVIFDMGDYAWTINGNDITAAELKEINLEVTMDTEVIPTATVEALAGGLPTQQISLTYDGEFGFTASLSLNLGAQYSGQYGNLFYYDPNGKLVFRNAGLIDSKGNVSVTFNHASDYVIVIGDDMTAAYATSDPENADPVESPKTGDLPVWPFAAVAVLGLAMVGFGVRKMTK